MFVLLFPAAATNSMSALLARLIALKRACEFPAPPQLADSTLTLADAPKIAFTWMAKSIALTASDVLPVPLESRNLSPMILVVQFTPATPAALLPTAPMVPDTWVPCAASSIGSHEFNVALKPCVPAAQVTDIPFTMTVKLDGADQIFAARSG